MNDMVSVIMPSYNTANFISESIESVQAQTYTNWELIIVDDCSTDNTDDVVNPYLSDSRIIYIKNDRNGGAAISRNRALREAKGKWIAFLDSDDLWMPEKLEKQITFMTNNDYHFSYTNYIEIDEESVPNGKSVTGPRRITKHGMYNYCWMGCLTVMYDAEVVGLIQIADIKKNNDYAMWLKVCKKADCYLLDEVLAKYRRGRAGSVSSHSIKTMIEWHYKLFREAEDQNAVAAVFNTCRNLMFGMIKKAIYVRKKK
jgi:glycosyltransferase involved in cell wall biosynthesis